MDKAVGRHYVGDQRGEHTHAVGVVGAGAVVAHFAEQLDFRGDGLDGLRVGVERFLALEDGNARGGAHEDVLLVAGAACLESGGKFFLDHLHRHQGNALLGAGPQAMALPQTNTAANAATPAARTIVDFICILIFLWLDCYGPAWLVTAARVPNCRATTRRTAGYDRRGPPSGSTGKTVAQGFRSCQ